MSRNDECHAIIHTAAASSAAIGAGLAQLPCADTIPLMGIQTTMIISLAKVFDLDIDEGIAKGILASCTASMAGKTAASLLVGWIPFVGNAINASTAAGVTEAVGWAAVSHFENQEREKKQIYQSGYQIGERDTKDRFNNLLKTLKGEEKNYLLIAVAFKYMLKAEGYKKFEENTKLIIPKIQALISNINKETKEFGEVVLENIEELVEEYQKEGNKMEELKDPLEAYIRIFNVREYIITERYNEVVYCFFYLKNK